MILDFDCNHTKINSIARSLEEIRNLDGIIGIPTLELEQAEINRIVMYAEENWIQIIGLER